MWVHNMVNSCTITGDLSSSPVPTQILPPTNISTNTESLDEVIHYVAGHAYLLVPVKF